MKYLSFFSKRLLNEKSEKLPNKLLNFQENISKKKPSKQNIQDK